MALDGIADEPPVSPLVSPTGDIYPAGALSDPLVPIRLELVVDGKPIQESFTWNSLEKDINPETFAAILVSDLGLPESAKDDIATSMLEQIAAFVPSKPRASDSGESRQVVRLDMRLGHVLIRDQFEWDLSAPENCPESFAVQLCTELGLGTEFAPAVAHAVREQLNEIAEFEDMRPRRPPIDARAAFRPPEDVAHWEPVVECLSVEEQERLERKEKREARLMRRNRGKADKYGKPLSKLRYHDPQTSRRRSSSQYSLIDESGSEVEALKPGGRRSDSRRKRR